MSNRISMALFFTLSLLTGLAEPCPELTSTNNPALITTKYGQLQGKCTQVAISDPDNPKQVESILSWLGVPFAEPPVKSNRFKRPNPPQAWTGVRQAVEYSDICVQEGEIKAMSENCLYLNIYAPLKKSSSSNRSKLPIYIYIHGGKFVSGSGRWYNASNIVGLSDIIVVTFNYRLGPFGFMYMTESDIQGNMGFLDQHMALKWIHENAEFFNGDRNRITVGGHSAGSFSIGYHLIYEPSWPLIKNVIFQSGAIFMSKMNFMPLEEASRRTSDVFASLGCSVESKSRMACIQELDSALILQESIRYGSQNILQQNSIASYLNPMFHLVQNGIEFNKSVKEAFESRAFKSDFNLINGYNKNEGSYFIENDFFEPTTVGPYSLDFSRFKLFLDKYYFYFPTYPTLSTRTFRCSIISEYTSNGNRTNDYLPNLITILSEHIYICPSVDFSSFYASYNKSNKVFRYSYDYRSSKAERGVEFGVTHGEEQTIWSGQSLDPGRGHTSEERRFSKKLMNYWTNFVKCGDPNVNNCAEENEVCLANAESAAEKYPNWPVFIAKPESEQPEIKSDDLKFNLYFSLRPESTEQTNDDSFLKCKFWRQFSSYPSNM